MNSHMTFPRTVFRRLAALLLVVAGLGPVACDGNKDVMGPPGGGGQMPVANAGPDQTVSAHVPVRLDGSASTDPGGGGLSYQWSLTARPAGSGAALDDPAAQKPSFVPDLAGEYRLGLVVSNGAGSSSPDEVAISAEDHTATATVSPGGGVVISSDGSFSLAIPAGALAQDTEIRITPVPRVQYPDELSELSDDARVYDLGPDGLEFAAPARVSYTIPGAAINEDGYLEAPLGVLINLAGGAAEPLEDQVIEVDRDKNLVSISGDLAHFSQTLFEFSIPLDESGTVATIAVSAVVEPKVLPVGAEFIARVIVNPSVAGALVKVTHYDKSDAEVKALQPFTSEITKGEDGRWIADDAHECAEEGIYTWRTTVFVETKELKGFLTKLGFNVHRVDLDEQVECVATGDDPGPFTPYDAEFVEGMYIVAALNALGIARRGGASLLSLAGVLLTAFEGVPLTATPYGMLALQVATAYRALVWTSGGAYYAPVPAGLTPGATAAMTAAGADTVQLSLADLTVPGITDNTGNTTDGIPYNNDPSAEGWLLTQFEDRNILFLVPGASDLEVDPNLAEAFYTGGQSVFGSARPISAFAGPNGFTANDPMLAVTIADDGSGEGEVLKLDLVNGKAVATVVDEVFVQPEPRRIRCLSGICAASSFGTSSGGFGGVMFFSWDGQDGFQFIINRITYAIGIDLIQDGDRILVASTDFFNNTYAIDELTPGGQYVGFEIYPVPQGCVGPGHVIFRSTRDVVLSCNTSGLVVGDEFDPAP